MSSWTVELKHSSGATAQIALIDDVGPLNSWKSLTPDAFLPASGTFLNQLGRINPSVQPSWVLNNLDIDKVVVGSQGDGEVFDNPSPPASFPLGQIRWVVISGA